jgi:hypothetical protein
MGLASIKSASSLTVKKLGMTMAFLVGSLGISVPFLAVGVKSAAVVFYVVREAGEVEHTFGCSPGESVGFSYSLG